MTRYSEKIKGEKANWNWDVIFDMSDGFLGISQIHKPDEKNKIERVLLSKKQVKALLEFLKAKK